MKKAMFAVLALVVTMSQFGCDLGLGGLVKVLGVGADTTLILEGLNVLNGW